MKAEQNSNDDSRPHSAQELQYLSKSGNISKTLGPTWSNFFMVMF